jgi:hypothetical protein
MPERAQPRCKQPQQRRNSRKSDTETDTAEMQTAAAATHVWQQKTQFPPIQARIAHNKLKKSLKKFHHKAFSMLVFISIFALIKLETNY